MSKIFISHSSHDNAKALAVARWLEEKGWGTPFLDISARQGLAPGKRWRETLTGAAGRCEAVICLLTPAWLDSGECRGEFKSKTTPEEKGKEKAGIAGGKRSGERD